MQCTHACVPQCISTWTLQTDLDSDSGLTGAGIRSLEGVLVLGTLAGCVRVSAEVAALRVLDIVLEEARRPLMVAVLDRAGRNLEHVHEPQLDEHALAVAGILLEALEESLPHAPLQASTRDQRPSLGGRLGAGQAVW